MSIWSQGGLLIVDRAGRPIECPKCPCVSGGGETEWVCTLPYVVKETLTATLTFSGVERAFSIVRGRDPDFPDHWIWYAGETVEEADINAWYPCGSGPFRIEVIDFLCDTPFGSPIPVLGIAGRNDAGLYITNFAFFSPPTDVSQDPIHLSYAPESLEGHGVFTQCDEANSDLSAEVTF